MCTALLISQVDNFFSQPIALVRIFVQFWKLKELELQSNNEGSDYEEDGNKKTYVTQGNQYAL